MCAGARSLLYGSALGLGGVIVVGVLTLRVMEVKSPSDLRERLRSAAQPLGDGMRETLLPIKAHMQVTSLWCQCLFLRAAA
jgi:hypothetical protein